MTDSLHIAIDARWIFRELSGIGLYTQELIAALTRCPSPHRFTLIFNHEDVMARTSAQTGYTSCTAFTGRLLRSGPYAPADQISLPLHLAKWGVDVYHATNFMMPLWKPGREKRVVTIHDLIPLLYRDHAPRSKKNRLYPVYRRLITRVAESADAIISVSESTRGDIIKHLLPEGEAKIAVIHEGVNPVFRPVDRPARAGVEFLFVGRRDPYKNLPMLIQSLHDVRRQGHDARLRIIGGDDPRYPEARELANRLNLGDAVHWSGYVPDRELLDAYQQTDVFVLPSRYEGFGLPVLEAMACGTPVICSNTSSLPEVAGDAALLIDPSAPATLTEAMEQLMREPDLRKTLSDKGLARAAQFTWEETARKTMRVYEKVAGCS